MTEFKMLNLSYIIVQLKKTNNWNMNLFNNNNTQGRSSGPLIQPGQMGGSPSRNNSNQTNSPNAQNTIPANNVPSLPQANANRNQQNGAGNGNQQINQSLTATRNEQPIRFKQIYDRLLEEGESYVTQLQQAKYKQVFSVSLQYFDRSENKKEQYEKLHKNQPNFGFGRREFEEDLPNLRCRELDNFWKTVVQNFANLFNVNELLSCQYLSMYITKNSIYQTKLLMKSFNNGVNTKIINIEVVKCLYKSGPNEPVVDTESQSYIEIMIVLIKQYFNEYIHLIKIIEKLKATPKRGVKYFREVIKKRDCDFVVVLWNKFKYFCGRLAEGEKSLKELYAVGKKYNLQKYCERAQFFIRNQLAKLLCEVVSEYCGWSDRGEGRKPLISKLVDSKDAIEFIDNDLISLVSRSAEQPIEEYQHADLNLKIILKVIPLCSLDQTGMGKPENIDGAAIRRLRELIMKTKSPYFESFRFLFQITSNEREREWRMGAISQKWQKIPKSVEWMMRSEEWVEWLAIFLQQLESNIEELQDQQRIMNQIVIMSKLAIDENLQAFWFQKEPLYQFQSLKIFISSFMDHRGPSSLLPILTKCLGGNVETTKLTLDLVGVDNMKKIRDVLIEALEIEDKHISSMGISYLYSYEHESSFERPAESSTAKSQQRINNYPEQELKFICRMTTNCRKNLSIVEEILFECLSFDSSGILAAKFLLECLMRLREYKIPALKCMRYLIVALDNLFVCEQSRPPFIIALGIMLVGEEQPVLTSNLSSSNRFRQQLYDMVTYSCSKASPSEEYRQSEKLRRAISYHICNSVRCSQYMSEYFPYIQNYQQQQEYLQLSSHIGNRQYRLVADWYRGESNEYEPTMFDTSRKSEYFCYYKSGVWFTTLLLVLQSPELLPMDYETIRLLLLKTKSSICNSSKNATSWQQQEAILLSMVKEIVNQTNVMQSMLASLEPALSTGANNKIPTHMLFRMENIKYSTALSSSNNISRYRYKQDEAYMKTKLKEKYAAILAKDIAIGCIAGTLQLIHCILSIAVEECDDQARQNRTEDAQYNKYPLIHQIHLYEQCLKYLTDRDNIYHYRLPIASTRLKQDSYNGSNRDIEEVEPATYNINLIQVIASYINFQTRLHFRSTGILASMYMNKRKNIEPSIYIEKDALSEQLLADIPHLITSNAQAFENVLFLSETGNRGNEIGIYGCLQVLTQLLFLNGGKFLYQCIMDNDYELFSSIGSEVLGFHSGDTNVAVFMSECTKSLSYGSSTGQESISSRCIVLEFITLLISKSKMFYELLFGNANVYSAEKASLATSVLRPAIRSIIAQISDEEELILLNRICLLLLAIVDSTDPDGYYQPDVDSLIKLPTNVIVQVLNILRTQYLKYSEIIATFSAANRAYSATVKNQLSSYNGPSICVHMKQYNQYNSVILFKGTIHICIEIFKRYIFKETLEINSQVMQLLLRMTPELLWSSEAFMMPDKAELGLDLDSSLFMGNHSMAISHTSDISCLITQTKTNKIRHNSGLNEFFSFFNCIPHPYGACYQHNIDLIFGAAMSKPQFSDVPRNFSSINTLMLNAYKINYETSLLYCHQKMLYSLLGLYLFGLSVGEYGHILSTFQEDCFLAQIENSKSSFTEGNMNEVLIRKLKDYYKFRPHSKNIRVQGSKLWGYTSSESISSLLSLARSLIQYLEHEHSWQHNNDLILFLLTNIIKNIGAQLFAMSGAQMTVDYYSLQSQYKQLLNYILVNLKLTMKVSIKVYLMLLSGLVYGYEIEVGRESQNSKYEAMLEICSLLEVMISKSMTVKGEIILETTVEPLATFTEKTLTNNLFAIFLIYSQILSNLSNTGSSLQEQIFQSVVSMSARLLARFGSRLSELNVNTMCLMNLFNSILEKLAVENEDSSHYKQLQKQVVTQYLQYLKRLRGNGEWDDPGFNAYYFQCLLALHEYGQALDSQVSRNVIGFIGSQIKCKNIQAEQQRNIGNFGSKSVQQKSLMIMNIGETPKRSRISRQPVLTVHRLSELLCNSNAVVLCLPTSIELKQTLMTFCSICCCQQYWGCRDYSRTMESIFDILVSQTVIYRLMETDRIKSTSSAQRYLESVCVAGQQLSLLDFTFHFQSANIILYFIESLHHCLNNSINLKNYYTKIINDVANIDELFWDKVTNVLTNVMDYVGGMHVRNVKEYPNLISKHLVMYMFVKDNNTDFAYDCDFLNVLFADLEGSQDGASGSQNSEQKLLQDYRCFLIQLVISVVECGITFITIWKSNDWKSNINWQQPRNSLLRRLNEWLRRTWSQLTIEAASRSKRKPLRSEEAVDGLRKWMKVELEESSRGEIKREKDLYYA